MKHTIYVIAAFCITVAAQAQNLILNGSFESGTFSQNSFFPNRMDVPNNSTVITNWVTGRGAGNFWWLTVPASNPQDGSFCVDLDSNQATNPPSFIQQSFATTVGLQYSVSAYYASEYNGGPATCNVLINSNLIGAVVTGSGSPDTTSSTFNTLVWTNATFVFTATSSTSTLRFQDATPGLYNSIIDNVSVVAVLEPSTVAIYLLGLAGLVPFRKKFGAK